MATKLSKDTVPGTYTEKKNTTLALTLKTWYYLVYSFEMKGGKTTTISFFSGNVLLSSETWTGHFIVDETAYISYFGIEQTGSYTNLFNGYIHNISLKTTSHVTTDTYFSNATSGCLAVNACWAVEYNKYLDKYTSNAVTSCAEMCTTVPYGCWRGESCTDVGCVAHPYCYLCRDRECTTCDADGNCLANSCASRAESNGQMCRCK
jgi:hypothetical protein